VPLSSHGSNCNKPDSCEWTKHGYNVIVTIDPPAKYAWMKNLETNRIADVISHGCNVTVSEVCVGVFHCFTVA
jgi:hypothetical protein